MNEQKDTLVSIILPVYNATQWLEETFTSIQCQTWKKSLEVSVYDDASTDNSLEIIEKWRTLLDTDGVEVNIGRNLSQQPGGVGHAKNAAILQSKGQYLCFLDADDVMLPKRIEVQLNASQELSPNTIIGCCFQRLPVDSTIRYTEWHNSLTEDQLYTQIYTAFGPTLIQPTWFCTKEVFDRAGPFDEIGKGFPEDLAFFYNHLRLGGQLHRIKEDLLHYRYHVNAATFSVHENTIWDIRVKFLEEQVLKNWDKFSIWNAGKQGRHLYRSLSQENREKVIALCDVDEKKISKAVYKCELLKHKPVIPIVHFKDVTPPIIICIKLNLTGGEFERNLKSLNLVEGVDYFHFS